MKKTALILLVALLISLTACSTKNSSGGDAYTVKFDSNGGSSVADIVTDKLTEEPKTSKENQIFCGWYKDSALEKPISYPFNVEKDTTLYAKWSNATENMEFPDSSVQFSYDNSYNYQATYNVVPKTFDLKALAERGYFVKIEATYDVCYEKDFDVPFDIGYLGAPDHDAYIVDPFDKGAANEDLPTSTTPTTETISFVVSAAFLLDQNYYLKLTTYNLQNVVHFTNIKVNLTCQPTE